MRINLKLFFIALLFYFCFLSYIHSKKLPFISPSNGYIIETFDGNSNNTFIVIRDNFYNTGTQKNIYNILKELKYYYTSKLTKAFVEGQNSTLNLSNITKHSSLNLSEKVASNLLNRGLVSGPQNYALLYENIQLVGIEDINLYNVNVNQLKMLHQNDIWSLNLQKFSNWLYKEKKRRFSKNLKKLEEIEKDYKNNEIGLENLIKKFRSLKGLKRKKNISNEKDVSDSFKNLYPNLHLYMQKKDIENLIDKTVLNSELKNMLKKVSVYLTTNQKNELKELSKKGYLEDILQHLKISLKNIDINLYPNLSLYFDLLSLNINNVLLKQELNKFIYSCKILSCSNDWQKNLVKFDRYFNLTELYFLNNISSYEHSIFESNLEFIYEMFKHVLKEKEVHGLKEHISACMEFYKTTEKRNNFLLKKLLRDNSKFAVIIIGGFHADNLLQALKTVGINYIDILPNESSNYRNLSYNGFNISYSPPSFNMSNNVAPKTDLFKLKKHVASELISELVKFYTENDKNNEIINKTLSYLYNNKPDDNKSYNILTFILELLNQEYIGNYLKKKYANLSNLGLTSRIHEILDIKEKIKESYLGVYKNNVYTAIKTNKNTWYLYNNTADKLIKETVFFDQSNIKWLGFGYIKVFRPDGWHLYTLAGDELFLEAGLNYIDILGKTDAHVCVLDKGKRYIVLDNRRFSEVVYLRIYDKKTFELLRILGPYYNNDPFWMGEINGIGYFCVMKKGPSSTIRSYGKIEWGIYNTLGEKIYEAEAFNVNILDFMTTKNEILLEINTGNEWRIIDMRASVLKEGTYNKRVVGYINKTWYFKKYENNSFNLYMEDTKIDFENLENIENISWLGSLNNKGYLKILKNKKHYIVNTRGEIIPELLTPVADIIWIGIVEDTALIRVLENNSWRTVTIK